MKKIMFLLLILISSNTAFPQNKSFSLELNQDTVLLGNYVIAKFTITNTDGDFEAPNLEDFQIISGPNTGSMFSIVNGKTTQQSSYTYYLKPLKEGEAYINPAYLFTGTDTLETVPTPVYVLPNPEGKIIKPEESSDNPFFFSFPEDKTDYYPSDRQPKKKKQKKKLKTRKL